MWWISTCKGFYGDNAPFLWLKCNILVTFEIVRPRPSFWCAICWDCVKFEKRCGYPCGKIKVAWNPNMWHIKIIVLKCWMQPSDKKFIILKFCGGYLPIKGLLVIMPLFCGWNGISLLPLKSWGQDLRFDMPYVGIALSLKKGVDIHVVK